MEKRKKLLFVIASLEGSGGSERALTNRVNYLVENYNYDITVVTTSTKKQNKNFYFLDPKIKQVNIPINFGKYGLSQKLKSLISDNFIIEQRLQDFINQKKFDICSSFGSETFLYKSGDNRPFIKIKENRFTYKKILTDDKLSFSKRMWRNFRFRKAIMVQKKMDCIITLTQEDADFWRRYIKNVEVIPNFIDLENLKVSSLKNKTVIAVGRLEKEKDLGAMIRSFGKVAEVYPDWKLQIYGDGSLKEEFLQLIQNLNLSNQVFINNPVKEIFSKYHESSMYVHTAFYEGFPNTMLEAMAHGLPVVAFESVGGVKVLVENNINGFLIEDRNVGMLSNMIVKLISDTELQKKMGTAARNTAENYGIATVMKKWHQLYSRF